MVPGTTVPSETTAFDLIKTAAEQGHREASVILQAIKAARIDKS